jgi:hypothetical protein
MQTFVIFESFDTMVIEHKSEVELNLAINRICMDNGFDPSKVTKLPVVDNRKT